MRYEDVNVPRLQDRAKVYEISPGRLGDDPHIRNITVISTYISQE
jgi:hypothetical protein